MRDPLLELRRTAGELAEVLAGIYVLVLFACLVVTVKGPSYSLLQWGLLACPAVAFVPSVVAAVKLRRTTDPERTKALWRRSLLLAVVGTGMLAGSALLVARTFR